MPEVRYGWHHRLQLERKFVKSIVVRRTPTISIFALLTSCAYPARFPRDVVLDELSCSRGHLPAYAHNDYQNRRPLFDALSLGYRGVEADVFLVDGVLRVGHTRGLAEKGGSLEALYLFPIRSLISRCGLLSLAPTGFLLTVELKQKSPQAYQALLSLLKRYEFPTSSGNVKTVQVVLVGWHPPLAEIADDKLFGLQYRVSRPTDEIPVGLSSAIRLISVDFGRDVALDWRDAARRARWLAQLRRTRAVFTDRLIRVHNVPVDSSVYTSLLTAGVDLLGVQDLKAGEQLLSRLAGIR